MRHERRSCLVLFLSGALLLVVVKVVDLDSLVAAIVGQPPQTQASCASLMVANAFFFSAMKAVFVSPEVLKAVLDDIHLQVSTRLCRPCWQMQLPCNPQTGLETQVAREGLSSNIA